MNKLIFIDGGQPFYLEDLQLLQLNNTTIIQAFFGTMLGPEQACLLQPCTMETLSVNPDLSQNVQVSAGTLVYAGMLCPFEAATLKVGKDEYPWICLRKTLTDLRTFENGQQHYCQEIWSSYLSMSPEGAERSWKLDEVKSYIELVDWALKNKIKVTRIDCRWHNGYSGSFTAKDVRNGSDIEYTLTATSTSSKWSDTSTGYKALVGTIDNPTYSDYLLNKKTPSFAYEGKQYHIEFLRGGRNIYIYPDDTTNISPGSVVIPVMPINITFKGSELKLII